jgi:hypothetical protein
MIKHVDGHYIAAQIRFVRQLHKGAIILLEGDDDAKVFGKLIDRAAAQTEVAFGKSNALTALDLLEDEGFPGVLAIVDADFDRIMKIDHKLENLFFVDHHDLDSTIFHSEALNLYVREYGDPALFKANFKEDIAALRRCILTASEELAYCRLANTYRTLKLNFKDLPYDDFIKEETLGVDVQRLHGILVSTIGTRCTLDDIRKYSASERARNLPITEIVAGHDICAILGIVLRKLLGRRRVVHTWRSEIEAGMRLAFDSVVFRSTAIFQTLADWEKKHPKYRLFAA